MVSILSDLDKKVINYGNNGGYFTMVNFFLIDG